jgi:prevent-host-death family protein
MSVVNTVNINTVNIHEAKTHLSRLVEQAAKGREFVIAKAGKPMVQVMPVQAPRRSEAWDIWPARARSRPT